MIKNTAWVFLATLLLGLLLMPLPQGLPRSSMDGLIISTVGPMLFIFLPAFTVSAVIAGVYYWVKKRPLYLFKYIIWGVWTIIALLFALGAVVGNAHAGGLIEDSKSGLIAKNKGKIWISENEKIGAFFPSKPEVINASSSAVSVKRFFSFKKYSEGNSQFSITIIPLDKSLKSHAMQKQFLEGTITAQATSAGAIKDTIKKHWDTFSDGRPQLYYEYIFLEQGYPISTRGFYVADGKRAINVSVLYLSTLPSAEVREVTSFLGTFTLVE